MTACQKPEVAFIGLGAMGFGMATHLVKQGYPVTGFDIYGPTLDKFRQAGGRTAASPAEAVANKSYCVCMVATAQQAQEVLIDRANAAVPALPRGAALLLCATVPCSYVQGLQKQLVDLGRDDIVLVDCPVSGGAARAADGTLSIMAGGSDEAIATSKFLLQEMADPAKLYVVRGGIGAGSNMKMAHQVLAAVQILAASEAMGLASHLGLDLRKTAEAVVKSNGRSWMFENRYPRMLDPNFQPVASALTIILKDAGIITAEARRVGFSSPMTSTAEQVYLSGLARGYGPDDDSSMLRLYTESKGKAGPTLGTAKSEEEKLNLVISLLEGIHLCAAAECIALSSHLDLDLQQVLDLCIHAAGGSFILETFGPELANWMHARSNRASHSSGTLADLAKELQAAVDEAQRLKVPLYLGSQALNMMRIKLAHRPKLAREPPFAEVIWVWDT